ncbi:MAG TPA: hypothetical protein DC084_28555, partial [Cupriavidus sp.]|nr:hypothetical protein [Cupriavidus sp.]
VARERLAFHGADGGRDIEDLGGLGKADHIVLQRLTIDGLNAERHLRLRGQRGLDLQARLGQIGIHIPIIFMTGYGDIAMSVAAMKAGAEDFMAKPFRDQDLLDAVSAALEKDRLRRQAVGKVDEIRANYATLTPRESEVMGLAVTGLLNKQIAGEIGIS